MARLQDIIVESLLVLTVTVLLNTRTSSAGNKPPEVCTEGGNECKNGGTCDTNKAPAACMCGDYMGVTCEDACEADANCLNDGSCNKTGTNNVCSCGDYKGDMCADECATNTDCDTGGTCGTTSPKKCTCKDSAKEGPGCKKDKSGASAVTSFSLMSLCVILIGYLL